MGKRRGREGEGRGGKLEMGWRGDMKSCFSGHTCTCVTLCSVCVAML